MDGAHVLLIVQARDTELDQLRFRRAHLPARVGLDAVLSEQSGVEAEGSLVSAERDQLAARQAELESDLGHTEKRLGDLDRQMRSGSITASRDLLAMAEQVASMKRRQSDIEDSEIEVLEMLEPLEARIADLQHQWARLEAEAVGLRAELAEAEVAVADEIQAVSAARDAAATSVDGPLLAAYERLRTRLGGVGAAPLVGTSCGGCHLVLSASELDRVRRAEPDEVVTCEQCGRILVR